MSSSLSTGCLATNSASVSSSCGGHAVRRVTRKAATATTQPATPQPNQASRIPTRVVPAVRSGVVATSVTTRRYPRNTLLVSPGADLRIPLPERACVRSLPADGRPTAREVRGLRRGAGRACSLPRRGPLQGLGVLLDRLRPLAQAWRRQGVERRRLGRRREVGDEVRVEVREEERRGLTADAARTVGARARRRRLWRRSAEEHQDHVSVLLAADQERLAADRGRRPPEPAA